MKGNSQVIDCLNDLLADELTAVDQYMVHSEMCANWGYERLHKTTEKRAIDEMKHAEKLIGRIIFLEGMPRVSLLREMHIGDAVPVQLNNDRLSEETAIAAYNQGIRLISGLDDNGSRDLLEDILEDEEEHIDFLESQLDQINQMGVQNYLAAQVE